MKRRTEVLGVDWRLYERAVAAFEAENVGLDMTVTPNARILGAISGRKRQIDVLIDARWGEDLSRRIIIDAKRHRRKLDIKAVESFEGMMRDCRAQHGILVCPNGWTEGARKRAQEAITLKLLSLDEVENSASWAHFDKCFGACNRRERTRSPGIVLWDGQFPLVVDDLVAVVITGKCDLCHNFHIWCWDCGERFALADEDEHVCFCGRQWVTSIEEEVQDPTGSTLNAVHLFLCIGRTVLPLDRRLLR